MRALLLALILPLTVIGCSKGEPKTDSKTTEAKASTAPAASIADQDKATDVEQARGAAKTEAAIVKEAADRDAIKAHEMTHDKLQSDFDASDRKLNTLKEQAAKATGAKKKSADAAIADITKREAAVMAGIAKLRDASGAAWDTTRTQVEADTALLDKAIVALETTLQ